MQGVWAQNKFNLKMKCSNPQKTKGWEGEQNNKITHLKMKIM